MPAISAQPYDYEFDPSGLVLFAIDMQRDYLEEGGYGSSLGFEPGPSRAIIPVTDALIGWTGTSDQALDALARL